MQCEKKRRVTLDGEALESSNNSYSATSDTEEFRFMYGVQTGEKGSHIVSVEDLSFGGIPYTISETEIKVVGSGIHRMADGNPDSIWEWVVFAIGYLLLTYLALQTEFRTHSHHPADRTNTASRYGDCRPARLDNRSHGR